MRGLLGVLLVACTPPAPPEPSAQLPAVTPAHAAAAAVAVPTVAGVPHGEPIRLVAITDAADAAVSVDAGDKLRMWPRLDGTREPVVVHAVAPVALALVRERDGFLIAAIDQAGGLELVRLDGEGTARGRTVVPAEPGFTQLAAGREALVALRTDHHLVRLDAAGAGRALAPLEGEQIVALAARHAHAVVGIADRARPGEIDRIRWVELAGPLDWRAAVKLPEPLAAGAIAISPSGRRLAGIHARTGTGVILELAPIPRVIATENVARSSGDVVGFLDEDRAVFPEGIVVSAPTHGPVDPWGGTRTQTRVRVAAGAAVGDGMVVGGLSSHLVLARPEQVQFLGYRDLGVGTLRVTGPHVTLSLGDRLLWLDEHLRASHAQQLSHATSRVLPIDDHRLLAPKSARHDAGLAVSVFDTRTGAHHELGDWAPGSTLAYDPGTQVFAIDGDLIPMPRARLDASAGTTTTLRPLATRPVPDLEEPEPHRVQQLRRVEPRGTRRLELLDPARAAGVVAIALVPAGRTSYLETFIDDGEGDQPLDPATSIDVGDATLFAVDRAGTSYLLAGDTGGHRVEIYKDGKRVGSFATGGELRPAAVDAAGTVIAAFGPTSVAMFERDGRLRWEVTVWRPSGVELAPGGTALLVNTDGGLVALDAATGARVATGCAWGFELSPVEPSISSFAEPVVCADERTR